jgi:hypothetical protein
MYQGAYRPELLYLAFQIPNVYDFITRIYGEQAEVIQNHEMFETQEKLKPNTENLKASNLVAVRHTIVHVSKLL